MLESVRPSLLGLETTSKRSHRTFNYRNLLNQGQRNAPYGTSRERPVSETRAGDQDINHYWTATTLWFMIYGYQVLYKYIHILLFRTDCVPISTDLDEDTSTDKQDEHTRFNLNHITFISLAPIHKQSSQGLKHLEQV